MYRFLIAIIAFHFLLVSSTASATTVQIRSDYSGKCIGVKAASINHGVGILHMECDTSAPEQLWTLEETGDLYRIVNHNSDLCVCIAHQSKSSAEYVKQCTGCADRADTTWDIDTVTPNTSTTIKNSNSGLCLILGSGGVVKQYSCGATAAKVNWKLIPSQTGDDTSFILPDSPAPSTPSDATLPSELTLLTYNTHLMGGEWTLEMGDALGKTTLRDDTVRRNRIITKIHNSDADVVALQEVWSPDWAHIITEDLKRRYPYSKYMTPTQYGGTVDLVKDRLGSGLVLLSKYPLSDIEFYVYPTFEYSSGLPKFKAPPVDPVSVGGAIYGGVKDIAAAHEYMSDKGVLTATVTLPTGFAIRVGITHTSTGGDWHKGTMSSQKPPLPGYATHRVMTPFYLNGDPYILAVHTGVGANIWRIEDYGRSTGKLGTYYGAGRRLVAYGLRGMSADHKRLRSFQLDGHPYVFGYHDCGANIWRINDDGRGFTNVHHCNDSPDMHESKYMGVITFHQTLGATESEETTYQIKSEYSGKCIGVKAASTNHGVGILHMECNAFAADQLWTLEQVGDLHRIVNQNSGLSLCIAHQSKSGAEYVKQCDNWEARKDTKWKVQSVPTDSATTTTIRNDNSGLCLILGSGGVVKQYSCNADPLKINWKLIPNRPEDDPSYGKRIPYVLGLHHDEDIGVNIWKILDEGKGIKLTAFKTRTMSPEHKHLTPFEVGGKTYVATFHECGVNIWKIRQGGSGIDNIYHCDKNNISDNYYDVKSFYLTDGAGATSVYIFGIHHDSGVNIWRVKDDPSQGLELVYRDAWVSTGNWGWDPELIDAFQMDGAPYLFALMKCCDQYTDHWARRRPGEAYIVRLLDDLSGSKPKESRRGYEFVKQLEEIREVRDRTVGYSGKDGTTKYDALPAIMMGDFNVHSSLYFLMDRLFEEVGAIDAFRKANPSCCEISPDQLKPLEPGMTIDWYNNRLTQLFHPRGKGREYDCVDHYSDDCPNEGILDRIDYVYVKPSGGKLRLTPVRAEVKRDWKYTHGDTVDWHLSDHDPVFVTLKVERTP